MSHGNVYTLGEIYSNCCESGELKNEGRERVHDFCTCIYIQCLVHVLYHYMCGRIKGTDSSIIS